MRDHSIALRPYLGRDSSEDRGEERVEVERWNGWVAKCNVEADGGAVNVVGNFVQKRGYWWYLRSVESL